MKTQRRGTNLTIEINIISHILDIKPLSAKASIDDKLAFLKLAKTLKKERDAEKIRVSIQDMED